MHVKLSCQFNIYAFDVNFKCLMVPAYVTTGQLREFAETGAKVPFAYCIAHAFYLVPDHSFSK